MKIGFPDHGRQRRASGHHRQDRRQMNRGLTADPLECAGPLFLTPGHRLLEEFWCQLLSPARIESVELGNTESTAQVAAREVQQMRRYKLGLFAVLDPMPKHTGTRSSLA